MKDSNAKLYTTKPLQWSHSAKILGITISSDRAYMQDENMNLVLQKMKAVANAWQHRGASIIGKVLVSNSLITSL